MCIQSVSSGSYFNPCSVPWSISKGHITLGSNKSAILLSTFSSSPFAYVDPLHCNMAYLYLELLKDSLNEYAYAAELAGLSYDLQNTIYGMYVSTHVLEPSTHQHFLYWFAGSIFDWGCEFNFFFLWLIIFSHHWIFKLALTVKYSAIYHSYYANFPWFLFFFKHLSSDCHIFLLKTKLDPDLGLDLSHSVPEVLVFDNREWNLPTIVKQKVGLYYFPRNSDCEAAYSYSSVMFLHYHATAWGIKAFLLFFFLLVATFMLILSIATWHTCLSGYWRMI